jgi:hypothetical protein
MIRLQQPSSASEPTLSTSLLQSGFTQPDLNLLAGQFPDGAWWLNPKALDFDAPSDVAGPGGRPLRTGPPGGR